MFYWLSNNFCNWFSKTRSISNWEIENRKQTKKNSIIVTKSKHLLSTNLKKKKFAKNFHNENTKNQNQYHVTNDNLNYYESNDHDKIVVNFTIFIVIKTSISYCRYYQKTFSINNNFHRHIRFDYLVFIKKFVVKSISLSNLIVSRSSIDFAIYVAQFAIYVAKINFIDVTKIFINVKFLTNASIKFFVNTKFFANVSTKLIIRFNVNFISNVDIEYNFRDWNYAKTKTFLSFVVTSTNICLNIEINVFFVDRVFFKTQTFKTLIRIMISLLKIRDLNINDYEIWKYVICDIYLSNVKNDKKIVFFIQREIHLIDNLKINIFFDNDITSVEKFIIDIIKKHIIINNIEIFIALNIRSFKVAIQYLIYLRKIIMIFSYTKMIISIHNVILSNNRDFLFESNDDIKFSIYFYFVNTLTIFIIIRNEQNVSIQISKNYRLNWISKLNFSNVFYINDSNKNNVRHLIVKKFKFVYRIDWFKKFIFICVMIYIVIVIINVFIVEIFTFIVIFVIEISSLTIISSISIFDFVLIFVIEFELKKFSQISLIRKKSRFQTT